MLPTIGLFKSIPCPYFDNGDDSCKRPYCHFKHTKKDDESVANKIPEYTATPRIPPKLLTLGLPTISEPVTKKRKLEYTPVNPGINTSKPSYDIVEPDEIPVYIPSTAPISSIGIDFNAEADNAEKNAIPTTNNQQEFMCSQKAETPIFQNEGIKLTADINKSQIYESSNEKPDYQVVVLDKRNVEEKSDKNYNNSRRSSHVSSESSRKSSRSSKSRDTSSNIEKKSDSKRSHGESTPRRSDPENLESKRHEKKSSRSRIDKPSSKSSSSSSKSTSSSTSRRNDKVSTSERERSHKRKKAHSPCSVSTKSRVDQEEQLNKNVVSKPTEFSVPIHSPFNDNLSSDEDDVKLQCKLIFEEEFKNLQSIIEVQKSSEAVKLPDRNDEDKYIEANKKKRMAHEGVSKAKSITPTVICKPNHVRNAMQAIYQRQQLVNEKNEKEAEAAEKAVKEAEANLKEAAEALRKAKEKSLGNLTPLIPKSYLTPSKPLIRSFAPVANILALERAKKKIQELKAAKQGLTPSQTAARGVGRVAHAPTLPAKKSETSLAPPVLEPNSTKISYNIRMQYYNIMITHCSTIYPNCNDAWERAQTEELAVFKKCNTPIIYKSSAMLAINKLKKEALDAGSKIVDKHKTISHDVILAGKQALTNSISVNTKSKSKTISSGDPLDRLSGEKAYALIAELCLTEEQLVDNGYPRPGNRAGSAIIKCNRPNRKPNDTQRYCSRCSKVFDLSMYDSESVDECNYHPKHTGYRRGFADNLHRCCQQPAGTAGCTYGNYHVSDYIDVNNLTGFVTTLDKDESFVPSKKDIYAIDCEMCYTTHGIELTRVTVVDISGRTVYDALVKPDNKIVDYNTTYSGITAEMLQNESRTLRDVQAILLSMINSQTVLIGHSLESDLKALKLIHKVIVDTSVLFPHKMGPPQKRALKTLCIENLKRIIQENEGGHDSAEDAEVCIELVKFYLRNKIS